MLIEIKNKKALGVITSGFLALFSIQDESVAQSFEDIFGQFSDDYSRPSSFHRPSANTKSIVPNTTSLNRDVLVSKSTLRQMEKGILELEKIVTKGGWPVIPIKGSRLKQGSNNAQISKIKKQLVIRGDLSKYNLNMPKEFDSQLESAIIKFQKRHGIKPSGFIGRKTRGALGISAKRRLSQMRVNKRRLENALLKLGPGRNIIVNVPDYSLQAVDGNRIELSSKVIVGRRDRQTPVISTSIQGINFNPYWHVPKSIAIRDLIPRQRKNRSFLRKQNFRVYKSWGGKEINPYSINWSSPSARKYLFRQDPGDHNALGRIRVHMPNKDIVYLHDTPTKKLYARQGRAFSSGCVRVQNIKELTRWILMEQDDWGNSRIENTLKSRKRVNAMIKNTIPVQFLYITSWVDSRGNINFREDIYRKDNKLANYRRVETSSKERQPLSP